MSDDATCALILGRPCCYPSGEGSPDCRYLEGTTCVLELASGGEMTLADIGDLMGVTRERIRQIERIALVKLVCMAEDGKLEDLRRDLEESDELHAKRSEAWDSTIWSHGETREKKQQVAGNNSLLPWAKEFAPGSVSGFKAALETPAKLRVILWLREERWTMPEILEMSELKEGTLKGVTNEFSVMVKKEKRDGRRRGVYGLKPRFRAVLDALDSRDASKNRPRSGLSRSAEIIRRSILVSSLTASQIRERTGLGKSLIRAVINEHAEHDGRGAHGAWRWRWRNDA